MTGEVHKGLTHNGLVNPIMNPRVKVKEAYSNLCIKIHLTSKLTQYLTNIFKMRFLMRNCIKYAQQCQNGIFEKMCRATNGTQTSYMDLPLYIMYTLKYRDSLITDADKHGLRPC